MIKIKLIKTMKEFYQYHKKAVIIGGIILAFVLIVALFIAGALFGSSNGVNVSRGGFDRAVSFESLDSVSGFASSVKTSKSMIIEPEFPSIQEGDLSEKKVIKNASLSLVVKKIEQAMSAIKNIVDTSGGFVENSSVYETGDDKKGGSIVVRVPEDTFDASLEAIKDLAVKVSREDVNARDVTEQFVDMEARLKNMKAEEQQYLGIMKRAVKIEDVLNVAKRLSDVRSRVERLEGQLNYLSRQVDMSTIRINLTAEADVEVFGIVWSPVSVIKQGVRDMLQSVVDFVNAIIAFVFKLPIILLWITFIASLLWIGWKGVIIIKRKFFSSY